MAKVQNTLISSTDASRMVCFAKCYNSKDGYQDALEIRGYWPLSEWDELVAFVNENRPDKPEPTRAPEDFIREADEAKDVS